MAAKKTDDGVLTVGLLAEKLKELPADAPVGVVGHFGEFHPIRLYSCGVEHLPRLDVDGITIPKSFWIEPPDIGPVPD